MRIAEAVAEHDLLARLGVTDRECEGARHHSPTPLFTHAVLRSDVVDSEPTELTPPEDVIHLCGTCRDNVRVYVALCQAAGGALPWDVRQEFGNAIRALGQDLWSEHYEESRG